MALKVNPFSGSLDLVVNPGSGPVATDFATDSGSAVPTAGGEITIAGGTGVSTSGASNTVTVTLDTPVLVENGGTGVVTLTDGGVVIGSGTDAVTSLGQATDGQLIIGDTGADPVLATLTAGTGMTITNAAGSITLAASGVAALAFPTDSGTATPAANALTVAGGTGINTSGAGSTATINLDSPVIVANGGTGATSLTDGGLILGSGTAAVTVLGQATNGQLPIGSTGVDCVLSTITAGTGMTVTNGAGTITLDASGTTPISFPTDSGTATPAANALTIAGGTGINTSGSGATATINLDTPVIVANGGTGATSLTDGGVMLGSGTSAVTVLGQATNGQLVVGSTGADPVLATITAGTDISITNGAGTITINSTAAGGGWVEETGTTRALVVNENVVGNNGSLITMTLPTTAAFGSIIRLAGKGAGFIKVGQNASEIIHFGTSTTTTGVTGSITSTQVNDAVELLCIVADTEWQVLSSVGSWTVA